MPTQAPHIDGLPIWAQLVISVLFGLAALGAAYQGYFKKSEKAAAEPTSTAILAASITDGFAMRTLNESIVRLDAIVRQLSDTMEDQIHHQRNSIDVQRELCGRTRELREAADRLVGIAEHHLKS